MRLLSLYNFSLPVFAGLTINDYQRLADPRVVVENRASFCERLGEVFGSCPLVWPFPIFSQFVYCQASRCNDLTNGPVLSGADLGINYPNFYLDDPVEMSADV